MSIEPEFVDTSVCDLLKRVTHIASKWKIASFQPKRPCQYESIHKVRSCYDLLDKAPGTVFLLGSETMNIGRTEDADLVYVKFTLKDPDQLCPHYTAFSRYFMVFGINKAGKYVPFCCFKTSIDSEAKRDEFTEDQVAIHRLLSDSIKISQSDDYKSRVVY